jgi:hypothetical protein
VPDIISIIFEECQYLRLITDHLLLIPEKPILVGSNLNSDVEELVEGGTWAMIASFDDAVGRQIRAFSTKTKLFPQRCCGGLSVRKEAGQRPG